MPEVSRFLGIVIRMFVRGTPGGGRQEHGPAHFHASYGETGNVVHLDDLSVHPDSGRPALPKRARALVLEWAKSHPQELAEAWSKAQANEAPGIIPGLE